MNSGAGILPRGMWEKPITEADCARARPRILEVKGRLARDDNPLQAPVILSRVRFRSLQIQADALAVDQRSSSVDQLLPCAIVAFIAA